MELKLIVTILLILIALAVGGYYEMQDLSHAGTYNQYGNNHTSYVTTAQPVNSSNGGQTTAPATTVQTSTWG
ncbi:MAG: hypothetical protein KGH72_05750 [Candidatus Micrarchaeota archaeon]|nr:hypothetical protein [Candidatus Micrarchaeota archaeon]